jgi:FkbH-like protein
VTADRRGRAKCLVWDLDGTLWRGVLLEGDAVAPDPRALAAITALDERGVLQSIASRNDAATALAALDRLGLRDYFLVPQIHFGPKADSLRAIAAGLRLGLDALAFIDDDPHERAQVALALPEVLCLDPARLDELLAEPALVPEQVTPEARRRRLMYREDAARQQAQESFAGPSAEFLATLDLELTVAAAREDDLARCEELTVRTHQLNATGVTYDRDELRAFTTSPRHHLWIARLRDRFGDLGTVALALVERGATVWTLRLLLASCRVQSLGAGGLLLGHVMRRARAAGARLQADFVPTRVNRMMRVTFSFAGFGEVARDGERLTLEHDLATVPPVPAHVRLIVDGA